MLLNLQGTRFIILTHVLVVFKPDYIFNVELEGY